MLIQKSMGMVPPFIFKVGTGYPFYNVIDQTFEAMILSFFASHTTFYIPMTTTCTNLSVYSCSLLICTKNIYLHKNNSYLSIDITK